MLDWGIQVMKLHADRKSVLEVEFLDEEGTGGMTQEQSGNAKRKCIGRAMHFRFECPFLVDGGDEFI